MVDVFRASAEHAGAVARLQFDFNTEFDTEVPPVDVLQRRYAALLERDDVIVVLAGNPHDTTGFAFLTLRPTPFYEGPIAQLEELYVRPDRRDGGIGTALMALATELVKGCGAAELQINVDEVDAATRRFYEGLGFLNVLPGTDHRMLSYEKQL